MPLPSYYQRLQELEGGPVKTERVFMGLSAGRLDYFRCGCVRTYIARTVGGHGESEEELKPCDKHQYLLQAPAPSTTQPIQTRLI